MTQPAASFSLDQARKTRRNTLNSMQDNRHIRNLAIFVAVAIAAIAFPVLGTDPVVLLSVGATVSVLAAIAISAHLMTKEHQSLKRVLYVGLAMLVFVLGASLAVNSAVNTTAPWYETLSFGAISFLGLSAFAWHMSKGEAERKRAERHHQSEVEMELQRNTNRAEIDYHLSTVNDLRKLRMSAERTKNLALIEALLDKGMTFDLSVPEIALLHVLKGGKLDRERAQRLARLSNDEQNPLRELLVEIAGILAQVQDQLGYEVRGEQAETILWMLFKLDKTSHAKTLLNFLDSAAKTTNIRRTMIKTLFELKDCNGMTPFQRAYITNDSEQFIILMKLAKAENVDIDPRPLIRKTTDGHILNYLLEHVERMPKGTAARQGAVEALIDKGFASAVNNGDEKLLKRLLDLAIEERADVPTKIDGQNALFVALKQHGGSDVSLLLEQYYRVHERNFNAFFENMITEPGFVNVLDRLSDPTSNLEEFYLRFFLQKGIAEQNHEALFGLLLRIEKQKLNIQEILSTEEIIKIAEIFYDKDSVNVLRMLEAFSKFDATLHRQVNRLHRAASMRRIITVHGIDRLNSINNINDKDYRVLLTPGKKKTLLQMAVDARNYKMAQKLFKKANELGIHCSSEDLAAFAELALDSGDLIRFKPIMKYVLSKENYPMAQRLVNKAQQLGVNLSEGDASSFARLEANNRLTENANASLDFLMRIYNS